MIDKPTMPRTFVYIDGFNFYYGCFRNKKRPHWTQYKWLDLEKFCDLLFPKNNVVKIKYYTAIVRDYPPDTQQSSRQKTYFTALSRLTRVKIIFGHFLGPKVVRMPQCDKLGNYLGNTVTVLKTEEKGSDVNLAVDLLFDCIQDSYDCAIIVSNDSDLVGAIKLVREEYKKKIGIVNPHKRAAVQLAKNADFRIRLSERVLASSQLPEKIDFDDKAIEKPRDWR